MMTTTRTTMIHPHLGINADSDKGCHMEVVDHFEMMFTTKKTAFYINEKPFDSFGVPTDPKGAILLSIFGEEEGKEEEKPASGNVFSNGDGGAVKRGSSSNGSVGISDLISSLYNQQHPQVDSHNNKSVSVSNVAAPNLTYSNESKLNSDEDEDGREFKSTEWETGTKSQDVKVIERECWK
ncbi:hypothetical protein JHK85_001829 [Glycine max]|nr:hypothetical protein JHK85_001829 [Glycine max]KAG5089167.1 hypothetical protein JHK86_001779 [Glycine max]